MYLNAFKEALKHHKGTRLSGQVAYRYFNSALLTQRKIENPLDSNYSYKRGYRFNFPGSFPALYLGISDFVCTLEAGQRIDPLSTIFDNSDTEPMIMYSIKVSGHFANLVEKDFLKKLTLAVDLPEYLVPSSEWERAAKEGRQTITHEIGQAVFDAGFDGIIYYSQPAWDLRSFYHRDMISNICVFMSKENPAQPHNATCRLELIEALPFTKKLIN